MKVLGCRRLSIRSPSRASRRRGCLGLGRKETVKARCSGGLRASAWVLKRNHHRSSYRNQGIQIDDVFIQHPKTAARGALSDRPGLIRAVNSIERVLLTSVKIKRSRPEGVLGSAFHPHGQARVSLAHSGGWMPSRPSGLPSHLGMSLPACTVAADGTTEANGLSALEREVKPMLKRVDHDGAGRFLCRIVDERAAELVRYGGQVCRQIGHLPILDPAQEIFMPLEFTGGGDFRGRDDCRHACRQKSSAIQGGAPAMRNGVSSGSSARYRPGVCKSLLTVARTTKARSKLPLRRARFADREGRRPRQRRHAQGRHIISEELGARSIFGSDRGEMVGAQDPRRQGRSISR